MSSGGRVSIPNNVRKMILNIKEINGNHTEEEIYLMLKECNMDPNETAQKLLFQDTFHEVKRKKDRRKENVGNKESVESRWRPGGQGRGSRGGRGNHSLRSVSNDGSGGRNALGKENGLNQVPEKGAGSSSVPTTQETKYKKIDPATSSLTVNSNGPSAMVPGSSSVAQVVISSVEGVGQKSEDFPAVGSNKLGNLPPDQVSAKEKEKEELQKGHLSQQVTSSSSNSHILSSSPGVYFSASDPVLVPSHDPRVPNAVGAIKREVGSQRTPVEQISSEATSTAASEVRSSSMQGKISNRSIGRSQQVIGPQKVSPSKEWKPKPTNTNVVEGFEAAGFPEVPVAVKADIQPCHELGVLDSEKDTSKLQKNLEEFHISNSQHVIIPDHLHVPEAEKLGFCFGSFDSSFDLHTGYTDSHENETNPAARSETSESVEEMAVHSLSNQDASATTEEGDFPEHSQSPSLVTRNLSPHDGDSAPTLIPEFSESKQETELQPGTHQYPVIHTSPNYGFGFMPPMVGTQLAPFENSESQAREGSRLPSFIIQQPIDPAAYYAQFYRSGADSDGRVSPFHSSGATTKYTGSTEVLSSQTSQSAQENGSSVLSTGGPSPIATQPTGHMQSSLAVPQQQLPLFRQPTGIPIPHYPPTYLPYGHYFPQFYMPPPAIHQFLSNGAFPQQSQAGSVYPAPPGATAKYSLPQYKTGNNTGESTHVGGAGSYAQYGSPPTAYNPSSTSASTANEDLSAPQMKEGNPHILGQQNEGSAAWIFPPGRDISNLQTSSFYNFPQGQVAFNPSQGGGGGHGNFTNMYHHHHHHHPAAAAQAVSSAAAAIHHPLLQQQQSQNVAPPAADSAGPGPTVYQQQPHHAQNNWPSNY